MALGPLFISIESTQLTAQERELLQHPLIGGVILFTYNYSHIEQLKALVADIKAVRNPALIVGVDYEGGRVQRFEEGFLTLPSMQSIGQLYDMSADAGLQCAHACGQLIGAQLAAVSIDLCFAPVLDIDYDASSIIGHRSFHAQGATIVKLATALITGLNAAGMAAVGKHFPGHGYVSADSHLELPVDPRELAAIQANDLIPFQQLHSQLAGIMTAHVVYEQIDAQIATYSQYWLKSVLRHEIGFQGLIFTDDLDMQAAQVAGTASERVMTALQAGCDVTLLCNDRPGVQAVLADERFKSVPTVNLAPLRLKDATASNSQQACELLEKYGLLAPQS